MKITVSSKILHLWIYFLINLISNIERSWAWSWFVISLLQCISTITAAGYTCSITCCRENSSNSEIVLPPVYQAQGTVLHTTVGPTNVYKKSEGQIM